MFKIFAVLFVLAGGVYAGVHFHLIKNPSLSLSSITSKIPSRAPASTTSAQPQIGKIAGIATEKLSGVGTALTSLVNTSSDSAQVTVDVQKISDQIGAQMEKLPAQLVEKAKVAYCEQVLIEATRSATSH